MSILALVRWAVCVVWQHDPRLRMDRRNRLGWWRAFCSRCHQRGHVYGAADIAAGILRVVLLCMLSAPAFAAVHQIVCTPGPACIGCIGGVMPCAAPSGCLYDDAQPGGWASDGELCPPPKAPGPDWRGCRFAFRDAASSTPLYRSVAAPWCTCDGQPLPCALPKPTGACRWLPSWTPGCP